MVGAYLLSEPSVRFCSAYCADSNSRLKGVLDEAVASCSAGVPQQAHQHGDELVLMDRYIQILAVKMQRWVQGPVMKRLVSAGHHKR